MAIFSNTQWTVSEDGMNAVAPSPSYEIAIDRILDTTNRSKDTFYDWPVHMAEKTWVNSVLFNEAFEKAIRYYSKVSGQAIDEVILRASFHEARRISGV